MVVEVIFSRSECPIEASPEIHQMAFWICDLALRPWTKSANTPRFRLWIKQATHTFIMKTKKNTQTISTLAALTGLALAAGAAHAAIAVTGGDFESPANGANTQPTDIPMWFDTTVQYADAQNGSGYTSNGTQSAILYNEGTSGYMYQSLGTLETGTVSLDWSFDQLRATYKNPGYGSGDLRFFYGVAVGADGTDIDTLGLTQIGSTYSITQPGVDTPRSGSVDVSSLAAGTTIWMDFSQPSGQLVVDNVSVTAVVPEPTTTALLGLGGLALVLRRRK